MARLGGMLQGSGDLRRISLFEYLLLWIERGGMFGRPSSPFSPSLVIFPPHGSAVSRRAHS
jgi:hypothetical protein